MIGQGGTISRFVAHECGLQGKDQHSRLIADMVFDALMDVRETILAPLFHAKDHRIVVLVCVAFGLKGRDTEAISPLQLTHLF